MRVLILEKDAKDQKALAKILKDGGYPVPHFATSYEELLEFLGIDNPLAGTHPTDAVLILMDLIDPIRSIETCRKIRKDSRYASTPILTMAKNSSAEFIQKAITAGATDYIPKPFVAHEMWIRLWAAMKFRDEIEARTNLEARVEHLQRELEELRNFLRQNSLIDQRTGLINQRGLEETLRTEFKRAYRNKKTLSVGVIEIDYFKEFEKNFGSKITNEAVQRIVKECRIWVKRPADVLARYSDGTFVFLLPDTPAGGVEFVGKRMLEAIQKLKIFHPLSEIGPHLTASIGVATADPYSGDSLEDFSRNAFRALDRAKAKGRNQLSGIELEKVA